MGLKLNLLLSPASTREMHRKLVESGVPVINIIYPLTNHAFDRLAPQVSPPMDAGLCYMERCLALMV